MHDLCLFVFLLQLALHFEISLSLAFDSLLFYIADHACMHSLEPVSDASCRRGSAWTYRFFCCLSPMNKCDDTDRSKDGTRERDL